MARERWTSEDLIRACVVGIAHGARHPEAATDPDLQAALAQDLLERAGFELSPEAYVHLGRENPRA